MKQANRRRWPPNRWQNIDPGWNPLNSKKCRREAGGNGFANFMSLNPEFVYLFHINILSIYSPSRRGWSGIKSYTYFLGKEVLTFISSSTQLVWKGNCSVIFFNQVLIQTFPNNWQTLILCSTPSWNCLTSTNTKIRNHLTSLEIKRAFQAWFILRWLPYLKWTLSFIEMAKQKIFRGANEWLHESIQYYNRD